MLRLTFLIISFLMIFRHPNALLRSKLWRINIVMKHAKGFKRVKVLPKDVIVPLVVLLGLNLLVLIVWSIIDPLKWDLVTIMEDPIFKRPILVQGECSGQNRDAFLGALLAINGIAIALTLWQAYLARNIRTDLSESKYVCWVCCREYI